MLVEDVRGFLVFEGLALHHVAPVTGGVAHAQEDGFAGRTSGGESLVAPWMPVHRVVLVLEQIRTGLGGEAVGHQVTTGAWIESPIVRARRAAAKVSRRNPAT